MSNTINETLIETIIERMPDLAPAERESLQALIDSNDLESLWQWQKKNYGKVLAQNKCNHPGMYERDMGDLMYCVQCDKYMGNRAHWD